ncbi:DUF502 domain-containing protein [Chloroflexota bacterium]
MRKVKDFLKVTILGGLIVLLPVAILVFLIKWLVDLISDVVDPLSDVLVDELSLADYIADIISITVVVFILFVLGMLVKTQFGTFIYEVVEKRILRIAPGYSAIRESIGHILGHARPAFSQVALAQLDESETLVTAFVTDTHPNGRYTVFVPTGPNPTSGNIYHINKKYVHIVDISVDEAMRSIVSCGAGSKSLISKYVVDNQS